MKYIQLFRLSYAMNGKTYIVGTQRCSKRKKVWAKYFKMGQTSSFLNLLCTARTTLCSIILFKRILVWYLEVNKGFILVNCVEYSRRITVLSGE
jgi:hypothetical protein